MKKQSKIQWLLVFALLFASVVVDADANLDDAKSIKKSVDIVNGIKSVPVPGIDTTSCSKAGDSAKNFCIVSMNSTMQKAAAGIGILMGAATTMATMNGSCSKFAEATKIAQLALTAYNSMCGMAQQSCESSCTAVSTELSEAMSDPTKKASAEIAKAYVDRMKGQCQGYKLNLAAAGVGLTTILTSSALNESCKKETAAVDCAKDPMNATCAKALDCSKPENAANTTCICQKTPNTPGCSGYSGSNQNQVQSNIDDSTPELEIPTLSPNVGGADVYGGPSTPSQSGNGVAPTGGGGGGGGLSGGSDGSAGAQKAKANGLNTNILSGYEGGGGGGGGFRGGGSGSGSYNSGLNAYLPNGSKDPARQPATQLFGNGQVTGAGSKSNFEKVNERYGEAKSSLLGN